jgi:hypothetical protein
MRLLSFAVLLLGITALSPSYAQTRPDSPKALVERGMSAYLSGDASAAIKAWVKGSALESNTQALSQANFLRQIEDFYGKPQSIDILKEVVLSPRSQLIYCAVNYEKGIAYARFQAYRTESGAWISTEFRFHTEASQVLPTSLLSP